MQVQKFNGCYSTNLTEKIKLNEMSIQEIKTKLTKPTHPVAKAFHKSDNFKVLIVGFKKGMILKERQAHLLTKLTVLEGRVVYEEADKTLVLNQYDEVQIPVDIAHSVEALEK